MVLAAAVDSHSLIFCFFKEVGHFCELGGSRESRKPFRRKAGAKRFTSRPGALRAPRGRPDLKNDRLLNLLACDKIVAEAVLRKPLKVCGMRAMRCKVLCLGAGSAFRGSIPVASAAQQPKWPFLRPFLRRLSRLIALSTAEVEYPICRPPWHLHACTWKYIAEFAQSAKSVISGSGRPRRPRKAFPRGVWLRPPPPPLPLACFSQYVFAGFRPGTLPPAPSFI